MNILETKVSILPLNLLHENAGQIEGVPANPRILRDERYGQLVESLRKDDLTGVLPLKVYKHGSEFVVLGGNMRLKALRELKDERYAVSCVLIPEDTPIEILRKIVVLDNSTFGEWDMDMLANEWDAVELSDWGVDVPEIDEKGEDKEQIHEKLQDKFIVPPFSVLNTREGYWQERKRVWNKLIQDNCESREGVLAGGTANIMRGINDGTSLLDPVIAELACRWFGIENGGAFDCFAGDTAFGFVASHLGMNFTGIELRKEQVDYNNERTNERAKYICDDGQNICKYIAAGTQDLLFSCPPYYDLEVYSSLPNDASNQATYKDFLQILRNAFTGAIECLRDNRFAVIVVGDIRDENGFYRDFTGDIKKIFTDGGMRLYNEAIIVEAIGTLPQRVVRYMKNRKLGKCHQNMLVFYKGDAAKIHEQFKLIEYGGEDIQSFGMDCAD